MPRMTEENRESEGDNSMADREKDVAPSPESRAANWPVSQTAASREGMALLNLGCGAKGHPAFDNVDLIAGPGIIGYDLRQGIPFPDQTYDLVYHSTMLSLLRPSEATRFMRECWRVLRPGGVLRVVTEDLEQMCRVYLDKLATADSGDRDSANDHEWMLLELYDQATREFPGGGMVQYLSQDPLPNEAFVYARTGEQGRYIVSSLRRARARNQDSTRTVPFRRRLREKARRLVLKALIGSAGIRALEVGRFRLFSGQVTHRVYDRYSLKQLFLSVGFTDVLQRTATESSSSIWERVNLDLAPGGQAARPHALIMEAQREP